MLTLTSCSYKCWAASISWFTFSRQGPFEHCATPILYTFSSVHEANNVTPIIYNKVRKNILCICLVIYISCKNKQKKGKLQMISSFIYQKITIVPHSTERGTVVSILYGTYKFPVLPLSNFLDDFLLFEKITLIRCRGNGTEAPPQRCRAQRRPHNDVPASKLKTYC